MRPRSGPTRSPGISFPSRPACGREQDRLVASMDAEDPPSIGPWLATLRALTAGPETPEQLRAVVVWFNHVLAEHGVPLH